MILSFRKHFRPLIESGSKIHTIRADPHARWAAGRKIHMATGVRTRKYHCFKEAVCVSVQVIKIHYHEDFLGSKERSFVNVIVDGEVLDGHAIDRLAINDGFKDTQAFYKWFDSEFEGRIIHWTDFRY